MSSKFAISVTIAAVLIFAAAFMPWGEVPFGGMQLTLTITGWNGSITLGGLKLPNWLVVLAAAGVTALCWLKVSSVLDAPPVVLFAPAAYGLLHAGFALVVLMSSDRGAAGVGALLTGLAFSAILVVLVQHVRSPKAL